jgi:hypothetical protein
MSGNASRCEGPGAGQNTARDQGGVRAGDGYASRGAVRAPALWLRCSAGRNSLIYEELVEGVTDEVFNIRFRDTELHDRNLSAALAKLRNVGLSPNRMLTTVDRVDSRNRSRWTVYPQVDADDGVAVAVDRCKLIEARSVQDGFGVIGRNCRHIVRACWTTLSSLDFHGPDASTWT